MKQTNDHKNNNLRQAIDFLRSNRPLRAEELCRDYLADHQGCTDHLRLLSHTLMKQKRLAEAEEQLRFALDLDPQFPHLHEDLGSVLALQSHYKEAVIAFEKAIVLQPSLPHIHKKLALALAADGRGDDADQAFTDFLEQEPDRALIAEGVEHQNAGRNDEAIDAFRRAVKNNPENVTALRCLAVAYWQITKNSSDAEALLRKAIQISPNFYDAWQILGDILVEQLKYAEAIKVCEQATRLQPDNAHAWSGLGNAYGRSMYPDKSAKAFAKSLSIKPDAPHVQMAYAHELKTLGDQSGALTAYRKAIQLKPNFGEVYWSMANLKIFIFEDHEVDNMIQQLDGGDLSESSDVHFRFAAGKAFEDKKDYEQAWHYYHTGNQHKRMTVEHDPPKMELHHKEIRKSFSKDYLGKIAGQGCDAADPIFIVGLPRSGSTLIEQILASHSQVEGTSELPIINKISESLGRYRKDGAKYPQVVHELRNKDLRAYGQQYIKESNRHRTTDKPFFTDKLPNNFPHVGFIHSILPNAKVINARRHPFDSCLGGYKQLFGRGQNYTYDMLDLAHYYRQYDTMMKYWHEVLPNTILDVHYEETVTDLETQVRAILAFCGLPFEENCLRFYETERAVKTASSEQVRQPIYTGALGKWRHYEEHLGLWQEQLGSILKELPEASKNAGL